ncbi:MAG: hypothetical protein WCJ60_03295 [bacterium]
MNESRLTLTEHNTINEAVLHAGASDASTIMHGVLGGVVAGHVLLNSEPNWVEFGMHTFASSLDYIDGHLKDKAVKLASSVLLTENRSLKNKANHPNKEEWQILNTYDIKDRPQLDERIDKAYFYVVMAALIKRAKNNGNHGTVKMLTANLGIVLARDGIKTHERFEAAKHNISTHATKRGKNKTKWQSIGLGVLTSPLAKTAAGRAIGVSIISLSTGLGLNDLKHYKKDVHYSKIRLGI